MKIQFASDLHLEFEHNRAFLTRFPLNPKGEILLLAGDIGYLGLEHEYDQFFQDFAAKFEKVYLVPGNHEFYGKRVAIDQTFPSFRKDIADNICYLNNQAVEYEDFKILFTTLFTRISRENELVVRRSMNDFHLSRYHSESNLSLTIEEYNACHQACLEFLEIELAKPTDRKVMVVTHHPPFPKNLIPNYPQFSIDLSEAFHVDLMWLIEKYKIDHWISGHTHLNFQSFRVGGTWFHSNMLGYVQNFEHRTFDLSKVIDV